MKFRDGRCQDTIAFEPTPEGRRMFRRAKVFTSGMAAKACRVAPRTVGKWFDSGKLPGYRLPGCNDRRIPRHELIRFMKLHNIPLDLLGGDGPAFTAVLSGCGGPWCDRFAEALGAGWSTPRAACLFDAALAVAEHHPDAVVFDAILGRGECAAAASLVRAQLPDAVTVCVAPDDCPDRGEVFDLAVGASDNPALAAAWLLERVG